MSANVHAVIHSPVGELTLIADENDLLGIHWPGQKRRSHFHEAGKRIACDDHAVFVQTCAQLGEYFTRERAVFDIPLSARGDSFSRRVWDLLQEIPLGERTTYGELAIALGNINLAQRVGQAVGANPIGIVIPCHRVVGVNGSLTGFAGGLKAKAWLLEHEEPETARLQRLF